jgi:hypothetical protein
MPTVPLIGEPVVISKGAGAGAGSDADDALLVSLQALRPKVAAKKSRIAHNMFLVSVRSYTSYASFDREIMMVCRMITVINIIVDT